MAEANVTSNNNLPTEVLVKIFDHSRPNLNELVNIVDVCQLSRDVVIHQHMSVNNLVIRHPDDINDLVSLLCKPVSFINLHIVWDVPSDVDCSSVSLDALANVTSLTHLQSFMLKVKDGDKDGYDRYSRVLAALLTLLLQTSTDTLTHLQLSNTVCDVSRKVVELLEAFQQLSHLVLNGCNLSYNDQTLLDIIPTLTHLELLDLRKTSVSEDLSVDLSLIAAIKRGCPNISNNIMIDKLEVRPSDDVSMLQSVSHVGRLYIEELDADQLTTLISCLNEYASQLSVDDLWVTRCKNHITDDILLSLVRRLRGLKGINAYQCRQLTNEGVVNVIRASPQLKEISIADIQNINTGIIQLLDHVDIKQNLSVYAQFTNLSDQMMHNPGRELYTGKSRNICLTYRRY